LNELLATVIDAHTRGTSCDAPTPGEALRTYSTMLFLLAGAGVHVEETEPWQEDGERRVLRAQLTSAHVRVDGISPGDEAASLHARRRPSAHSGRAMDSECDAFSLTSAA
jgi:hypothetical protein